MTGKKKDEENSIKQLMSLQQREDQLPQQHTHKGLTKFFTLSAC
jgi:hypothetical protein